MDNWITSWRTASCFFVDRFKCRSWLWMNFAVCFSNFFFSSYRISVILLLGYSWNHLIVAFYLEFIFKLTHIVTTQFFFFFQITVANLRNPQILPRFRGFLRDVLLLRRYVPSGNVLVVRRTGLWLVPTVWINKRNNDYR